MNLGLNKRDYVQAELVYEGSYRKEDRIVLTLSGVEYGAWAGMCDLDGLYALEKGERLSVTTGGKARGVYRLRNNDGGVGGFCGDIGLGDVQCAQTADVAR